MPSLHYDLIIVPGSQPQPLTWKLPRHIIASLEEAEYLLHREATPAIALSGKWSLSFDKQGITPPATENHMMADYLLSMGVPAKNILQENESKDTMSALYSLKRTLLVPRGARHILIIAADFRIARLAYLTDKILGPNYIVNFQSVISDTSERYSHETQALDRTRYYLEAMKAGDDHFLDEMFYDHPFYTAPWPPHSTALQSEEVAVAAAHSESLLPR